jgi:hypothetical protein
MEYDPIRKNALEASSTVPCPCKHPSHGSDGCDNVMEADDETCPACQDHVPYTDMP